MLLAGILLLSILKRFRRLTRDLRTRLEQELLTAYLAVRYVWDFVQALYDTFLLTARVLLLPSYESCSPTMCVNLGTLLHREFTINLRPQQQSQLYRRTTWSKCLQRELLLPGIHTLSGSQSDDLTLLASKSKSLIITEVLFFSTDTFLEDGRMRRSTV